MLSLQTRLDSTVVSPVNLKGKKILFLLKENRGLGDIACCLKIATAMVERASLSKENILIASDADPREIALFNRLAFTVLPRDQAFRVQDVALQIILPEYNMAQHADFLLRGPPTVSVTEYGLAPFEMPMIKCPKEGVYLFKALGLSSRRGELGILIDHDLANWGFPTRTATERLRALRDVNPALQEAILGEGPFHKQIAQFSQSSKLYTGYCAKSQSLIAFILAVIQLNAQAPGPLVIAIPGGLAETLDLQPFKSLVKSMTIRQFQQAQPLALLTGDKKEGCSVTIVCGRIHTDEVRTLLKASERELIATGNHSLSDSISENKNFVYESHDHTEAVREDLRELWGDEMGFAVKNDYQVPDLHQIFRKHREPAFNLTEKNRKVCQEKDCLPALLNLFSEAIKLCPNVTEPAVNFIANSETFAPSRIPFDRLCMLNMDQISKLGIDIDSQKSDLPELSDSKFHFRGLGHGRFLLRRVKA